MGGHFSIPRPPPPPPRPPPPPPDPREIRERKRVELTMARNDLTDKQQAYDVVAPDEASQRKLNTANAAKDVYVADKQKQFDYEMRLYNQSLDQADALANSATFILAQKYSKTLEQKHNVVSQEYVENKEKTFTNRRRFLDAEPQEGVPGIGNFQSVDEQILFAFWVSYLLFSGIVSFWIIEYLQGLGKFKNFNTVIVTFIAIFCVLAWIGHVSIRNTMTA
jgi:hypothetical protein